VQIANDEDSHFLFEPNDTNYTVANDVDILVPQVADLHS